MGNLVPEKPRNSSLKYSVVPFIILCIMMVGLECYLAVVISQHRSSSAFLDHEGVIAGILIILTFFLSSGLLWMYRSRKKAELEIRENDLWLRESQHNSHIGSYNFNIHSGIWKSSDELDCIFGITKDYSKNLQGWINIVHPKHQEEMTDHFLKHVLEQRNPFNKEYRIIRQNDCEVRWVHGLGNLSYDLEGNPVHMVGTIQDITERKLADQEIIKNEQRFEAIYNSANEAIFIHDALTGKILDVNQRMMEMFGYSRDEALMLDVGLISSNEPSYNQDRANQLIQSALAEGPQLFQWHCKHKKGHLFWAESSMRKAFYGEKEYVIVVVRDITERRHAEDALRFSEQKYRLLFENMTSGFALHEVLYDADWNANDLRFIEVNRMFEVVIGIKAEEVKGKKLKEAIPDMADSFLDKVHEVLRGETLNFVYYIESLNKYLEFIWHEPAKGQIAVLFNDITDRVQAENELKQARMFNDALLDSVPGLVYLYDAEGYLLSWNRKHEEATGYSANELYHMHVLDWYKGSEKDINSITEGIQKALSEGYGSAEAYLTKKNGDKVLYYFTAVSIQIEGKNYFTGIGLDITDRKKVEDELRDSEAKARLFVENTPLPVAMFDNHMQYLMASKRWSIDYKLGNQPLIGRSHYEVFPEIPERWKDDHQRVLAGEIYRMEADRFDRADGSTQWLRYELHPWRKSDGQIGGLVMFTEDITERKRNEEALRTKVLALTQPLNNPEGIQFTDLFNIDDLQNIQNTFAEATGVASIITYPDGTPITKPSNFCSLCNIIRSTTKGRANCYKSDAALGQENSDGPTIKPCLSGGLWDAGASITLDGRHMANWLIGQVKNDAQDEKEMLKYAKEIGADTAEFRKALSEVTTMSRHQFNVVAKSLYLLVNELSLKAYQNIQQARFIAERDIAVKEMNLLNENLELIILERTYQLEMVNKDLESFAHSVSHDLRAPLRHIDGFVKLLYSKIENPDAQIVNYFDKIIISSKRMSSMIDDLLSFSRLGRRELILSSVNLNIVIAEIIEQLKPDIESRQITWNLSELPKISGDKNLLKMVFENLISNAIKYTSKREDAVIEIGVAEDSNNWVDIFVKDNGVGFNMNYVNKLFGVFQRLHSSEEFEGTGIGLANVKQIVLKHNGSVRAEGKINEGAIFYITLPK